MLGSTSSRTKVQTHLPLRLVMKMTSVQEQTLPPTHPQQLKHMRLDTPDVHQQHRM
jgi:hypothetical protein